MLQLPRFFMTILLMVFLTPGLLTSQIHDYSQTSDYPFAFHHLQLTLEIQPDSRAMKGVATWQMSAVRSPVYRIPLLAIRTDIRSVRINEKLVEFESEGDSLFVQIPEAFSEHVRFKLEIVYLAEASYATKATFAGNLYTSLLPGAVANMLPVHLHPSVQIPTDIRMIVPHQWQAVATGNKLATTLLPEENRLYHWRSEVPVSVTDIAFLAGEIVVSEVLSGTRPIRLYFAEGALTPDEVAKILHQASRLLNAAESVADIRMPYAALNLIWLDDKQWELRQSTASMGFLYADAGPIESQLLRIVSGQFFGAWHRAPTLVSSDFMLIMQGLLAQRLSVETGFQLYQLSPELPVTAAASWQNLTAQRWNHATRFTANDMHPIGIRQPQFRRLLREPTGTYTWEDYLRLSSDTATYQAPILVEPEQPQSERYTASFVFDESRGQYELEILPEGLYRERYLNLTLRQFTDGMITDLDILASTRGDRIHLSSAGWIENMYFLHTDSLISIREVKPASFWLYQLRRDNDAARRIEASDGFSRVINDPDVQLVLTELIRNEPDEIVRRYLVSSLSSQLGGAVGTHQRFLTLLQDPSRLVRIEALRALTAYNGNAQVQRAVYRIISTSADIPFVNLAIQVYFEIIDHDEFYAVARGLLHEDELELQFTATVIPLIVQTSKGNSFAANLMKYMGAEYEFSLRFLTFMTLKDAEISASSWHGKLSSMLSDEDPRIRFTALEKVHVLEDQERQRLVRESISNEYDVRVLYRLQELLSQ